MVWSLPLPPSKILPGSFLYRTSCPWPFSFRPNCLISARFCVFIRPPPASGHPLSVRRKATNPPATGRPMSSPGFLSSVPYAGLHPPPRPVRLVVLGLGVGGGAKETAPPAMVLSPSTRQQAPPRLVCLRRRSISLFDSCGARLYVCPPLPLSLSLYNRTCPYTLPPKGRVFLWSLRAPLPRWTRPSFRLF